MNTALIGGGLGSMITALYLNLRGEEVTIFEKENKLGGRLSFVTHEEFRIDEGPTIVLLPDMIYDILDDLKIDRRRLKMTKIDPIYPLHFKNGISFEKWSDETNQLKEIERVFPGEENNYLNYMKEMKWRFDEGKKAFLDHDFVNKQSFFTFSNMRTLTKLKAYQSVKKQAESFFHSHELQEAFSLQTLYIGGSPNKTPALYSLVPFSEHYHGIWYVQGGYASLAQVLEEELYNRGVNIELNSEVTELGVEGKKVIHLTVNEKLAHYDRYIFNGDFPLIHKILKKPSPKKYVPSSSCVLVYLGLDSPLTTSYVHQFFMGDHLDTHMNEVFNTGKLPSDPSFYFFYPSLIDDSLAPSGKGVAYMLIPVPAIKKYSKDEYDTLAEKMLAELERRMDHDLSKKIIWKKIRTPLDGEKEGLFEGGSFGISPTLFQSGAFRPQIKPFSYENVYAVGASVHPGGGIPIVMHGAKLLASLLEKEGEA